MTNPQRKPFNPAAPAVVTWRTQTQCSWKLLLQAARATDKGGRIPDRVWDVVADWPLPPDIVLCGAALADMAWVAMAHVPPASERARVAARR